MVKGVGMKRSRVAAILGLLLVGGSIVGLATPAHADNCEPTEPVIRALVDPDYEEPGNEGDKPLCQATEPIYQELGCNDITLTACVALVLEREAGIRPQLNIDECLAPPVLISVQQCLYNAP